MKNLDTFDRRILAELQRDGSLSIEQVAERVHLSRNACWRRIKKLEEDGVITGCVALVDAEKVGLGLSVFVLVRTSRHDPGMAEGVSRGGDVAARDHRRLPHVWRSRLCAAAPASPTSKPMTGSTSG
jgi:DNA-binding Lrp family transcriptional regulator